MEEIKNFFIKYSGAIIGGIIAILLLLTRLYDLIIGVVLIGLGIYLGNYVQLNREKVKNTLKKIIDKL